MLHKTIIFSLGLLTLANCNAQKETKTSTKNPTTAEIKETKPMSKDENIIYFNEGENKFLKEYEMNVTFKGISEDSRCPEGVNCMWAGVAVAQIEVMGLATRPMTVNIATTENAGRNYHQSTEFNGYTISLKDVNPYPTSQDGAKALAGKYRIGIVIKKTGENSTTK
ncbi:hypothetical protein [Chryseobacterium sp. G0201]|uniref:hypothetical protein n=1 Tax=Chryseobacterium sp. G0201 TaxID=2487065 RepID=UPI000F513981|nr:hypothetical protein [Chryseobacterium sp. G0201]AZA51640.1 hypothetical protein EG348_00745 [Chryseobacterium sp. G0201]